MSENAIEIRSLEFAYGREPVLRGVDLAVPSGSIFGFLGRNGSGKTTTIKALLGLLPVRPGACRVLGLDPAADPLGVRSKVGYLAEDQEMYGWMRVEETIRWTAGFYPGWDSRYVEELRDRFKLPARTKVKALSKGQTTKLGLLLALGYHPNLVILDDPTLGLDPIARKEFLRQVIGLLQSRGVTVFFSSHLLYEIEPVADHIAILDGGRIVKTGKTDELREQVKRYVFSPRGEAKWTQVPGVLDVSKAGDEVSVTVDRADDASRAAVTRLSRDGVRELGLNLDEIFEAMVIGNRGQGEREVTV